MNNLKISKAKIMVVLAFLLGAFVVYSFNLSWAKKMQSVGNAFISSSQGSYQLQSQLTANYSQAYDVLAQCQIDKCNHSEVAEKLAAIKIERDNLNAQLEIANKKTETALKAFP